MQVLQMDVHYTCTLVKDHAYASIADACTPGALVKDHAHASIADAYTPAQLWKTMLMQVLQMDVGYTCTLVKDHAYASIADAYTPVQW